MWQEAPAWPATAGSTDCFLCCVCFFTLSANQSDGRKRVEVTLLTADTRPVPAPQVYLIFLIYAPLGTISLAGTRPPGHTVLCVNLQCVRGKEEELMSRFILFWVTINQISEGNKWFSKLQNRHWTQPMWHCSNWNSCVLNYIILLKYFCVLM